MDLDISGKRVCIKGTFTGYKQPQLKAALKGMGARVSDLGKADLLIAGVGVGHIEVDEALWSMSMGAGELQSAPSSAVRSTDGDAVIYTATTSQGLVLTRRFEPVLKQSTDGTDPCVIQVTATWSNPTSRDFAGHLWFGIMDLSPVPSGYEHILHPAWMTGGC